MMEAMAWVMKEKMRAEYEAGQEVKLLNNQAALPSKAIFPSFTNSSFGQEFSSGSRI